jgi:hypothetical protein
MSDNSKLADERIRLCERLVKYSDDIHCIAVHRDLANDLREAEALITLLADDAALRAVPADATAREALEQIRQLLGYAMNEGKHAVVIEGNINRAWHTANNALASPPVLPGGQKSASDGAQIVPLPLWAAEDLLKWMRRTNSGDECLYPLGLENLMNALIAALAGKPADEKK